MTVLVGPSCTACGACLVTCPTAALAPAPGRPAVVDARCTDCLACIEVCPADAIALVAGPAAAPRGRRPPGSGPGDGRPAEGAMRDRAPGAIAHHPTPSPTAPPR